MTWLNAAYRVTEDEMFEEQPNPSRHLSDFAQLLAFADAVGTSKGLLRVLCSGFQVLQAEVQGEAVYSLDLSARHTWYPNFKLYSSSGGAFVGPAAKWSSQQERAAVEQQVVQQLEVLLYFAYKLQREGLQKQLRQAIVMNSSKKGSLLYNSTSGLASERVLAVTGSSTLAFVNSLVMQPLSFRSGEGSQQLLEPVDLTGSHRLALRTNFDAKVLEDFMDYKAGDQVTIDLDLLQHSNISFSCKGISRTYPVRLMLGQESAGGWPV